ncbi:MAG: hypothetical protein M3276_03270 [Actinomycetota bacterium]|nr:hypothetical protein [Actinomycetota bacterium]
MGGDFTHFPAPGRVAIAVLDLVSRYWIANLVTSGQVTASTPSRWESRGRSPKLNGA